MKKIFLTGSRGLLGSSILEKLCKPEDFEVISLTHQQILSIETAELLKLLSDVDWIIHCAAQTNVEQCEKEPEKCYVNNCFLTEKIIVCSNSNAKILYVSSTGLYGNHESRPYIEYDKVEPTTVHHRSKHLSEILVLNRNAENIVVRTGWLFGDLTKNDFVSKIINQAKHSPNVMKSNSQQVGCPTYAHDVAKMCIELLQVGAYGVFNVTNSGLASRYDYVRHIISKTGADITVDPVTSDFFTRRAQVSDNETAMSVRLQLFGRVPLRPWEEALDEFLVSK